MIGSIIGGVMQVGGAIAGGVATSKAAKRAEAITAAQKKKNQQWYDVEMSKNYTSRSDAQHSINRMNEIYQERQANVSASQAVTGASDEQAALAKEGANAAIADATANIAAQASNHKDGLGAEYRATDAALSGQQRRTEMDKASAISGAIGGVSSAAAGIASMGADNIFKAKK